ncbi:hypothetical protein FDUTEX481_09369 [Tolypothrix sp. PCC 7601]|nr:hypothetical protein FDUTEX481_09369 [Tolypothrix sp. PCC 7601]
MSSSSIGFNSYATQIYIATIFQMILVQIYRTAFKSILAALANLR